ncbi:molybdopterin synthase catalytic subunit-like [Tropilaelaps mercedesae]|uniref:Molybdopterin synthase catalytic subunit-like n=1 Tax=Tropilaelaps mercedesae TaxID=418985 RepID=A0A1V9X7A3_9ACAR|nr:molybdopterin synthase catalytic subunit-like [Tropilaelaps mercedesae]
MSKILTNRRPKTRIRRNAMELDHGLILLRRLLDALSAAGLIDFELVPPASASSVDVSAVHAALHDFGREIAQFSGKMHPDRGQVQIKAATRELLEGRIEAFLHRKELEREAMVSFVPEGQCSRTVPFRYRRIGVEQVHNEVGPQDSAKRPVPDSSREEENPLESRLTTVEKHLGLSKQQADPVSHTVIKCDRNGNRFTAMASTSTGGGSAPAEMPSHRSSPESSSAATLTCPSCSASLTEKRSGEPTSLELLQRMKRIETRLLYLESISPEYSTMIPLDRGTDRV